MQEEFLVAGRSRDRRRRHRGLREAARRGRLGDACNYRLVDSRVGDDPALADFNFWGRTRNNITNYRQTQFVVNLMNGNDFGAVDPRMSRMLAPSADGQSRGVDPNVPVYGAMTTAQQPFNFFGYAGTAGTGLPSRYIFDDKSKMPFMTYAQLQFIKAEAAFRLGDKATALNAYRNGISAHIDFVNLRNLDANSTAAQISSGEKAAFLADARIVPTNPAALTLTRILEVLGNVPACDSCRVPAVTAWLSRTTTWAFSGM